MSRRGDRLHEDHSESAIASTPEFNRRSDRLCEGHSKSAIALS
ncbi:hypothetical protein [Nostoc sp.]